MARALAFVQLLIVCLGGFALHLLVKLHHGSRHPAFIEGLAYFLGRYALWLLAVPILWAVAGNVLRARVGERSANTAGVILTLLVFLIFAVPLCFYLR